jgi:hypothetical protein
MKGGDAVVIRKRSLWIRCLLLALIFIGNLCGTVDSVYAGPEIFLGSGTGGGSCVAGVNDEAIFDYTGFTGVDFALLNGWQPAAVAIQFQTSDAWIVTRYVIRIVSVDTASATIFLSLYADNGSDQMGTIISGTTTTLEQAVTATVVIDSVNLPSNYDGLAAGTKYWLKAYATDTDFNASTRITYSVGSIAWETIAGYFPDYEVTVGAYGCKKPL